MCPYVCIRACPLRDEERMKTPFCVWDRTKIWWFLLHFWALLAVGHENPDQTSALSLCKLYWTTAACWIYPWFSPGEKKKCLVWEYWSKTLCLHCRGVWSMTKKKLFHVCGFCKAVSVGVEKSMQSHVGFMMMLISCVLWLTFLLSTLHPVILAYYCFCSCTMVVIAYQLL